MSLYYEQKFVSPEPLYAEVKETMRSYFDTGNVDDALFPKWLEQCMRRFYKSRFKIEQSVLDICDFQACLPDDFESVREAWLCSNVDYGILPDGASQYYMTDCRVTSITDSCAPCFTSSNSPYHCDNAPGDDSPLLPYCGIDQRYIVTNKLTGSSVLSFHISHLLKPGNANARNRCGGNGRDKRYCANLHSFSYDTFDIRDNKFVVNFPKGTVYLLYYAYATDDQGEQLVPDNEWLHDFIRKFLIYKTYEQLSNQVTDETFNQIEKKLERADQKQAEAFIIAQTEMKKETFYDIARKIRRDYERLRKYNIR